MNSTPIVQEEHSRTDRIASFGDLVDLFGRDAVPHRVEPEDLSVAMTTMLGVHETILLVRWAENDGVMHIVEKLPFDIPSDRMPHVETAMHRIPYAGLGINHAACIPVYRMSIPFQPRGHVSAQEVRAYLSFTISQCERWFPAIAKIVDGELAGASICDYFTAQASS